MSQSALRIMTDAAELGPDRPRTIFTNRAPAPPKPSKRERPSRDSVESGGEMYKEDLRVPFKTSIPGMLSAWCGGYWGYTPLL